MYVGHLVGTLRRSALGTGLLFLAAGCFSRQQLAVRDQPPRAIPSIAIEPAPQGPGVGRVVLDSTDGPATVEEVVGDSTGHFSAVSGFAYISETRTKPICTSPCVVDLPFGNHQLVFRSRSDDEEASYVTTVVAGAKPSIYRVAPTRTTGPSAKGLAMALEAVALSALMLGPLVALLGPGSPSSDAERDANYRSAGMAVTVAGGVALGIGIAIDFAGRGTIAPGSFVQWEPDDGVLYRKGQ